MTPILVARPSVIALSDREALMRLIEYARNEAEDGGEPVCAQLLNAALVSLKLSREEASRVLLDVIAPHHAA